MDTLVAVIRNVTSAIKELDEEEKMRIVVWARVTRQVRASQRKMFDGFRTILQTTAHSLRGEFMHIGNAARLIKQYSGDSDSAQEECEVILRSIKYGELLLTRLLGYLDLADLPRNIVDLGELLSDVEALATPRLPSDVHLKVSMKKCQKTTITANSEQLMQVVLELVNNAVAALRSSGGKITLTLRNIDDHILVEVRDTGPGLPAQIKKDVFKKPLPTTDGTGVGLLLSNKVVSRMGGELRIKSSTKRGTSFIIDFPAYAPSTETSSE